MKTKSLFAIFLILLTISFVGCNDDDKSSIKIDKYTLLIDCNGGEETIMLSSNGYWEVNSIPEWITLSPTNGEYSSEIRIIVSENKEYIQRSTALVFVCGDASQTLDIKQLSLADLDNFLELDKDELFLDIRGSRQVIQLTANKTWQISSIIPAWLHIDSSSGERDTQITINADENREPEARETSLVFSSGEASATLYVYQPGLRDVVWGPSLPIFSFNKVSFTGALDRYDIIAGNLFVNPSIKDKIFLGNLLSPNAESNTDIPEFTGYTFNPITCYTTAPISGEVVKTFIPSMAEQTSFAQSIVAQKPKQYESFTTDNGTIEFYSYKRLYTLGLVNMGIKLDEVVSGHPYTQAEMTKKYGLIFSFKKVQFSLGMDYPLELIKEELKATDEERGVSYISKVNYGQVGLLIVESNTDSRDIKAVINKIISGQSVSQQESELIQAADISYVYFSDDNAVQIDKGGVDAINSYKNAIANDADNIYPVGFEVSNYRDHSVSKISYSVIIPE